MEESDQVEVDEAEIDQLWTSERNSSSESESEGIISGDSECPSHPSICTISVKKREELEKFLNKYKENKEKFLRCTNELMGVSSILRRERGDAVSFEKYKEILREKFGRNIFYEYLHKNDYDIKLPRDIELAKEMSKYSVDKMKELSILIFDLNENELECLRKLLRSFAYTVFDAV